MRVDKAKRQIYLWGVITSNDGGLNEDQLLDALDTLGSGPLTLRVNSPGGSVDAALAMVTLLRTHSGQVTVINDALAASAATFFFTESKFKRIASPTSMAMIHEPVGSFSGRADDFDSGARTLRSYTQQFVDMYARVFKGVSREQILRWLNEETYFTAKQQLKIGLVDRIDENLPQVAPITDQAKTGQRVAAAAAAHPFPRLAAAKVRQEQLRLASLRQTNPKQYNNEVARLSAKLAQLRGNQTKAKGAALAGAGR
jgi:ATP-dependent Clp endopeptidase proteolytic subunit ClpP